MQQTDWTVNLSLELGVYLFLLDSQGFQKSLQGRKHLINIAWSTRRGVRQPLQAELSVKQSRGGEWDLVNLKEGLMRQKLVYLHESIGVFRHSCSCSWYIGMHKCALYLSPEELHLQLWGCPKSDCLRGTYPDLGLQGFNCSKREALSSWVVLGIVVKPCRL